MIDYYLLPATRERIHKKVTCKSSMAQANAKGEDIWHQYENYYEDMLIYVKSRGKGTMPKRPSAKLPAHTDTTTVKSKYSVMESCRLGFRCIGQDILMPGDFWPPLS